MFQFNKIGKLWIAILMAMCFLLPTAECFAFAEEQNVQGICDEDEYLLLLSRNNYVEIYDSQGNNVGKCRAYINEYRVAATIGKNSVVAYSDGEKWSVFSMAQLKNILEFPTDEYYVSTYGDVCLVTDPKEAKINLYNNNGTLLYHSENEALKREYGGYGKVVVLENGYLIGVCVYTEEKGIPTKNPVWISVDGKESREITDPDLAEAFVDGKVSAFGKYLLVHDWENKLHSVYDLEGTLLLEPIDSYIYPYVNDNCSYDYNLDIALLAKKNQKRYTVYDKKLEIYATFPFSEEEYLQYASGFLKGMLYEELGRKVCSGFVKYNGEEWLPFARTEEGCLVYVKDELIFVPLEQWEDLSSLNEAYAVAGGYHEEGFYRERLIDRESGSTLMECFRDEIRRAYVELAEDYCLVTEERTDGYESLITILDNQNEICYSSDKVQCQMWKNGYVVLKRGIYQGIADRNGNWIVRTVAGWSE